MTILIACDSFKDALPALEVCEAVQIGIKQALPESNTILFPMADGGEGTATILTHHLKGKLVSVNVHDPLFRPIKAQYGLSGDGEIAIIDMAEASGLQLLSESERNPLQTTTLGTGELIMDAILRGVKKIILGIGGSATNDGGMGLATALGYIFKDKEGQVLSGIGANLGKVYTIESPNLQLPQVEVLCDVDNPLYGPEGATYIYGKQKGATNEMLPLLDKAMQHFSSILAPANSEIPGAGAAGGLGFGTLTFLNAKLCKGIDSLMNYANFDQYLKEADLVITGEGRIDHQTLHGKLIAGICKRATQHDKPVIAVCGSLSIGPLEIEKLGLKATFSILNGPMNLEEALANTAKALTNTGFNIGRVFAL